VTLSDAAPVTSWTMPKVVVMGVSGSGKSTIGQLLAERSGAVFLDSDDLHPEQSRAKMAAGIPLNDADRAPWLDLVARFIEENDGPIVAACSALKHTYRDMLRLPTPDLVFVELGGVRALIRSRQADRRNHFMPPALMESQFDILEPLREDERGFEVDVGGDPGDVVTGILDRLHSV